MRALRRWSSAVSARVHDMISKLENHEALADGAIRHVQGLGARAEVQLARVRRDGERLQESIEVARRNAELWSERAASIATRDEPGALECLRRRRTALADRDSLEQRLREHRRLEEQLNLDVHAVRERIDRLRHQRNQLRTRASTAEALRASANPTERFGVNLDEVFERWDLHIAEAELAGELPARDAFAADFERAEDDASLRAELATLLKQLPAPRAGEGDLR